MQTFSLVFSVIAIILSFFSFWYTTLRSGRIRMTKPTVIYFGPDGAGSSAKKVFVRTLLYSTGQKGNYIQNMHIKLTNQKGKQVIFNVWVYDDSGLKRGSGLFISKEGISANHHFFLNKSETSFAFEEGQNHIEIFIEYVNGKTKKIHEQDLAINTNQLNQLNSDLSGIYFDWDPTLNTYVSSIQNNEKLQLDNRTKKMIELLS